MRMNISQFGDVDEWTTLPDKRRPILRERYSLCGNNTIAWAKHRFTDSKQRIIILGFPATFRAVQDFAVRIVRTVKKVPHSDQSLSPLRPSLLQQYFRQTVIQSVDCQHFAASIDLAYFIVFHFVPSNN
jgi:hypothetical protein